MSIFERLRKRKKINTSDDQNHYKHSNYRTPRAGYWLSFDPAVLVGLISTISGCALQEDIARIARSFIARGQDILGMNPGAAFAPSYETQAHSLPRTAAARAAPI
jgi:hypothetical protein